MTWWLPATTNAVPSTVPRTLYCVTCDCSERALLGAVCWLCGGPTTSVKPMPPWPSSITGPAMHVETNEEDETAA